MSTSPEPFITSPKTICGLWLYLESRCQVPYETINPVYRTKKDSAGGGGGCSQERSHSSPSRFQAVTEVSVKPSSKSARSLWSASCQYGILVALISHLLCSNLKVLYTLTVGNALNIF